MYIVAPCEPLGWSGSAAILEGSLAPSSPLSFVALCWAPTNWTFLTRDAKFHIIQLCLLKPCPSVCIIWLSWFQIIILLHHRYYWARQRHNFHASRNKDQKTTAFFRAYTQCFANNELKQMSMLMTANAVLQQGGRLQKNKSQKKLNFLTSAKCAWRWLPWFQIIISLHHRYYWARQRHNFHASRNEDQKTTALLRAYIHNYTMLCQ